jgi:hypothetical protein
MITFYAKYLSSTQYSTFIFVIHEDNKPWLINYPR